MTAVPMYVFTGFLESGKTRFIQQTLEDPRFNSGERTLLLVLEEGEEEYDISTYPYKNVYIETLDYEELSQEKLEELRKKHRAEQIRVQFAARGLPLYADRKYGAPIEGVSIALWSCRLRFTHPQTGLPVSFCRLPPDAEPWQRFSPILLKD